MGPDRRGICPVCLGLGPRSLDRVNSHRLLGVRYHEESHRDALERFTLGDIADDEANQGLLVLGRVVLDLEHVFEAVDLLRLAAVDGGVLTGRDGKLARGHGDGR